MPFQPAPSIGGTVIEGRMDNQLVILDLNWFSSGGISTGNLSTLAGSLGAWVTSVLTPLLSRDVTFNRVRAIDLGTATGPVVESSFTAVGGVDQESAPNNVAACVSLRTEQRGRSARGRNFVPGVPNNLLTLNTLDAGFITDLVAAYNTLVGPGTLATGWELVVLSRFTGNVARANGIGIPVTLCTMIGTSVRSMRSREIGHGA